MAAPAAFPESTAWDRPGFLLWHATLRWQREVADALRPLGLTHVQFVLLAGTLWLEVHAGGPPSQRELAEHSGTDVMMTSQVVRLLEKQGLLVRETDGSDARVKRLRTTDGGRSLAVKAVEAVESVDDGFFGTDAGRRDAVRALRRLVSRDDADD